LRKHEDARDHWHCPFFRYCWDSGMSRLPTTRDCCEVKCRGGLGFPTVRACSNPTRMGSIATKGRELG
jgi:hypothetical protein